MNGTLKELRVSEVVIESQLNRYKRSSKLLPRIYKQQQDRELRRKALVPLWYCTHRHTSRPHPKVTDFTAIKMWSYHLIQVKLNNK